MPIQFPLPRYVALGKLVTSVGSSGRSFSAACSTPSPTQMATSTPVPSLMPSPTSNLELTPDPSPKPSVAPMPIATKTPPSSAPAGAPTQTLTLGPPATPSPASTLPAAEIAVQETKQITWAISDDLVALMDTPEGWGEDADLMTVYAGRKDVDALFLHADTDTASGLPAMSIYRLSKWDEARVETQVSEFLEPSNERKDQHVREGTIGGAAATILTSVSVSQKYGNERVVRAYVQLEDHHTWMIACYAAELDTGQHAECDAAVSSVRIAPPSFVRDLTTPTPTAAERAADGGVNREVP